MQTSSNPSHEKAPLGEILLGDIFATDLATELMKKYPDKAQEYIEKHIRLLAIASSQQVITPFNFDGEIVMVRTNSNPHVTEIFLPSEY